MSFAEDMGYDGYDIYDIIDGYKERIDKLNKEKKRRLFGGVPNGEIWTTADGTEMLMATMTDQHLENAIRYFTRLIDEFCDENKGNDNECYEMSDM